MIKGLKGNSHMEMLKELGLLSLEKNKTKGAGKRHVDSFQIFKTRKKEEREREQDTT